MVASGLIRPWSLVRIRPLLPGIRLRTRPGVDEFWSFQAGVTAILTANPSVNLPAIHELMPSGPCGGFDEGGRRERPVAMALQERLPGRPLVDGLPGGGDAGCIETVEQYPLEAGPLRQFLTTAH